MNQTSAKARPTRAPSSDGRTTPAAKGVTAKKVAAKKASAPRTPTRKPPAVRAPKTPPVNRFQVEALNQVSTAVMMTDRDLVIYYVNEAATELMRRSELQFRQIWPSFDPDHLLGQCIDQFHAKPEHQRRLLSDPANLPYRANIKVAGLSFGLRVVGQFDDSGEYVGCTLEWEDQTELIDVTSKLAAIDRGQATIEFTPEGVVVGANENFQKVMGYTLDDIVGGHHRMFVDPAEAASADYTQFWATLGRGQFVAGDFPRITKAGQQVWLRASYNPIIDRQGNVAKVVKFATDITEEKLYQESMRAQMEALDRFQASIEFTPEGTVVGANENFQKVMGYTLNDIVGSHHRMFVNPDETKSAEYSEFWEKLRRGQFVAGDFARITKSGQVVWLRASYNPLMDRHGKVVKVVKFATDITEEKRYQQSIEELVERASAVMGAVAEGDLSQSVAGEYPGQLVQLQDATNRSIENLSDLITQIRSSASSMSTSANEVALANQDLSRRTESQASSLEETASSMEEMTATVQQNADNARKASQLAVSAREQAQDGGQVVDKAVDAMRAISESSKKIADIIGVIDEIAFQTNLLALNAAVEAARAGDQGRGFAVVASEVRNLAQRSAGAAKEIKALIQDSLDKVDDGSNLVNQSGTQLGEIVNSVKKVSDIIAEIAAASEEQSAGIGQVNQAVAEMDHGTQQNAAMVEEAAAASESMQQLSHVLLELTQRFKVNGTDDSARLTPAPTPSVATSAPRFEQPAAGARRTTRPEPTAATRTDEVSAGDEAWQDF